MSWISMLRIMVHMRKFRDPVCDLPLECCNILHVIGTGISVLNHAQDVTITQLTFQ